LRGQPGGSEFLLTRIAERVRAGVEGEQSFRVRNAATDFPRDGSLIRNIVFIAPDANSEFRESLEQRSRSAQVMPAIAKEQIPGGRHGGDSAILRQ